jgi:hypothetical protein
MSSKLYEKCTTINRSTQLIIKLFIVSLIMHCPDFFFYCSVLTDVLLFKILFQACESTHHPLGQLVLGLTNAFNTTYGGVRVHPLLLSHAVKELKSITTRLYQVVRLLFPGLPVEGTDLVLPYKTDEPEEAQAENSNPIDG